MVASTLRHQDNQPITGPETVLAELKQDTRTIECEPASKRRPWLLFVIVLLKPEVMHAFLGNTVLYSIQAV